MKIIELLNKIANGEEVPKKIKHRNWLYDFDKERNDYIYQYDSLLYRENDDLRQFLNDEVEILEEPKGIPERVLNAEVFDVPKLNNMELSNIALTNKEDIKIIKDTLNKVLDYLESKGE